MSDDVVAFLRARLDEDEAAAREAARGEGVSWQQSYPNPGLYTGTTDITDGDLAIVARVGAPVAAHIARHDPARVLRDVEADRRLLAEADKLAGDVGWDDAIMFTVGCRAATYSDHPDYRKAFLSRIGSNTATCEGRPV